MTAGHLRQAALLSAAIAVFVLLIALGTWQLYRLAWKNALVEAVAERASLPPLSLANDTASIHNELEYRPVTVSGRYHSDKELRLYTVLGDPEGKFAGPGWLIITPLEQSNGRFVLINRGFVPVDKIKSPQEWQAGTDRVTVTGLLRLPQERNTFSARDNPVTREFFTRDPQAMAAAVKVDALPVMVDAVSLGHGILPQGGETRLRFPNRHLEYALTWYGLAAAFAGVAALKALSLSKQGKTGQDKRGKSS
jgi:surfeit locus 1 family protein